MTTYTCKECGKTATVEQGEVKRTCEHSDAVVLAHLTAHATGVGGMCS